MNEIDHALQSIRRLRIVFWSLIAALVSQLVVLAIAVVMTFCLYQHNTMLQHEVVQDMRLDQALASK